MKVLKINRQSIKLLRTDRLITFTNDRAVNMTGNPYFTSPVPLPKDMEGLAKDFGKADSLARTVRSVLNTQARQTAYDALIAGHMQWVVYIEETPGLTLDQLLSTGYTPYAERTQAKVPPPANKPTYSIGVNTGEIFLKAEPYKQDTHKVFYIWKVSEDKGATWQNLASLSNSHRRKTTGLELNKEYWFKVAYATTAGEGEASPYVKVLLNEDSRAISKTRTKTKSTDLKLAA